ncbi:MAG TPA: HAD family hydrolase [bacterium]|nr:HAD family hydrolase [bacterium]
MRKAIFLDRDGTINALAYDSDHGLVDSPATPEEFHLLPGTGEAIRKINENGLLAVVVSNQPGIAKGRFTAGHLDAVTRKMHQDLARFGARLDAVFYCLHHPDAVQEEFRITCTCRKPKPGLLTQGARSLDIDLGRSYLIGDGINDIEAGAAAGCRTAWVGRRRCDVCEVMASKAVAPDYSAATLHEAVDIILQRELRYAHS